MKKLFVIIAVPLLLLFACAEPQLQKPTIEKLASDLAGALEKLITDSTTIDKYIKTLTSGTDVGQKKEEFISNLRNTISTLGTKVQYLGIYEIKAATVIYSFDLGMKPDDVDKVYLLHLLLINPESQQRSNYTVPFLTLKNDPNNIYIAVVFKRDNTVIIYPKPIVSQ
ncbi:hypothetical protein AS159_08830 [Thermotoga sp. Ku-13t]|uniref:hypothetical protein n=1 Tax=Thermotoga sp. Ku-13t TaxID=1755813 RepID=UPI0013EAF025|nr:hypothetical protein [Thermotoga sp. Ku-13t]KAF2957135.1 hypothetical protein AS159_08830 [Thermotoga sp. Ku-13t]